MQPKHDIGHKMSSPIILLMLTKLWDCGILDTGDTCSIIMVYNPFECSRNMILVRRDPIPSFCSCLRKYRIAVFDTSDTCFISIYIFGLSRQYVQDVLLQCSLKQLSGIYVYIYIYVYCMCIYIYIYKYCRKLSHMIALSHI